MALSIIVIYRPYSKANMKLVHPDIANMAPPYESTYSYWMDGGSIGIKINDIQGGTSSICIPKPLGQEDLYKGKIYLGSTHFKDKDAFEVTKHPDTTLLIANILRNRKKPYLYTDLACAELSGRTRDYIRLIWRRFTYNKEYIHEYK